jgi:hypothetical protein
MFTDLGEYANLAEAIERRAKQSAASGFPPEVFARTAWRIVNSPRPAAIYFVPRSAGFIVAVRRVMPDWLWDGVVRRILRW